MITVQDALKIGPLQKARLVGGKKGLHRFVTSVNVMDAPDIINWVKEGELLLTTAYVIKDDQEAQEKLISGLHERGCAGLAVKARRFLQFCPEFMVEAADKRDFPLIELPPEHSFSDIMVPLLSVMLNRKSVLLEQSLEIHQKLTQVALKGGGMGDVIRALAELVDNPVFLYDDTGALIIGANEEKREEGQAHRSGSRNRSRRGRPAGREAAFRGGQCADVPVMVNHRMVGHITVLERSRALTDFDKMAMEHAATVIALYYMRQMTIDEAAEQLKKDFLEDLLSGRYDGSYASLINRAVALGFNSELHYGCAVFEINRPSKPEPADNSGDDILVKNQIGKHICRGFEQLGLSAVVIRKGRRIFAFLAYSPGEYEEPSPFIDAVLKHIGTIYPQLKFSSGYGRPAPLSGLKNSCEGALNSLEIGLLIHAQESFVCGYKEVEVYHLLREGLKGNELEEFVEHTVGSILKYDRESKTDLLTSLEVYFQCQGNITKAAQQLFIHRNTMIYRLERIRSLLQNRDLDNSEEMLSLQLGIRAARLIQFQI